MGMDVYGKKPSSEKGKYFRNNVWWWRPLWNYCCDISPSLAGKVKKGHFNDGDGLDAKKSKMLAIILQEEIDSGRTAKFEKKYTAELKSIPDEACNICGGTGKRRTPPECGPGNEPCNGCKSTGKQRPTIALYPFSEENVKEFVGFLHDCGGFEIC